MILDKGERAIAERVLRQVRDVMSASDPDRGDSCREHEALMGAMQTVLAEAATGEQLVTAVVALEWLIDRWSRRRETPLWRLDVARAVLMLADEDRDAALASDLIATWEG
jgi:hypothetical protein